MFRKKEEILRSWLLLLYNGATESSAGVGCLLGRGAPQDGSTPLHIAVAKDFAEIAQTFLAAGADKDARENVSGKFGGLGNL